VARKSTGGRRLASAPFSFYGKPCEPFDLSTVTTVMSIGGLSIKVSAAKMGDIVNLKPTVVVEAAPEQSRF
jgi:hypothetical protein